MALKGYEEDILQRMYNEEIIKNKYKPLEAVRSKIRWIEIANKYKVKKRFDSVMKGLESKGYVDSHGKSGAVYSLTFVGVAYVVEKFNGPK